MECVVWYIWYVLVGMCVFVNVLVPTYILPSNLVCVCGL